MNKDELHQKTALINLRKDTEMPKVSRQSNQHLKCMDCIIKKDFKSFSLFSICGGDRKNYIVSHWFERAFDLLTLQERIKYYQLAVFSLIQSTKEASIAQMLLQDYEFETLEVKILKGMQSSISYKLNLKTYQLENTFNLKIHLNKYLLRKSKKSTQKITIFCLQAIENKQPSQIRFEVVKLTRQKQKCLLDRSNKAFKQYILDLNNTKFSQNDKQIVLSKKGTNSSRFNEEKNIQREILKEKNGSILNQSNIEGKMMRNRSVIEQIIEDNENAMEQQIMEYIERKDEQQKQEQQNHPVQKLKYGRRNIFNVMLPHYNFYELESLQQFLPIEQSNQTIIYKHCAKQIYKMEILINKDPQIVLEHLSQPHHYKLWNRQINECGVNLPISSENSCICYEKHRALSEWYRERDFLYIKHLFKFENAYYIIDKSTENHNFIPFQSIQRAEIEYCITKVEKMNQMTKILIQIQYKHSGLLNRDQRKKLTVNYLMQYSNLQSYIQLQHPDKKARLFFDLDWQVKQLMSNVASLQTNKSFATVNFEDIEIEAIDKDSDEFYTIKDEDQNNTEDNVYPEISPEEQIQIQKNTKHLLQLTQYQNEKVDLNSEGYAILPQTYLKVKHIKKPFPSSNGQRVKLPYQHVMLKEDFVIEESGGIKLINQMKIKAQNNVIKFIMSTLKKNLFSGKGIMNISLPVEIFNCDSNLQRLCSSTALAPQLLELKACLQTDPIQRLKYCVAFCISNSVLYFDIDKAFNPILGETFQGIIDGCPVYGEQISHHPPISSIYIIGRGYKIYGCLEAKVHIHLNSGQGINEGLYNIEFDNGDRILFQTCPGEVTGVTVGDRKFRLKGKGFVIDPDNKLFCTINFEDQSGIFSKNKWKQSDQIQGEICRVTDNFVTKFLSETERSGPQKKQIEEKLCKINGRWVESVLAEGIKLYDIKNDLPFDMIHYQYPLNSNSNYREDLIYRKLNDLSRSQLEKERLEVLQRGDKKMRQKFGKKH